MLVAAVALSAIPLVGRGPSPGLAPGAALAADAPTLHLAQRIRRAPDRPAEPTPVAPTAPTAPERERSRLTRQSQAEVDKKNVGCVSCHTKTDSATMHVATTVRLACIDCHGGQGDILLEAGVAPHSSEYDRTKRQAHVAPRRPELWKGASNPEHLYAAALTERAEYIRFVNPGDLRAARVSCGQVGCHESEVAQVEKSMMTTGPMLWAAALYNNGVFPLKHARFGESYDEDGRPRRVYTLPPPTIEDIVKRGVLPFLGPLPRFEVGQPGNVLRVFERGQQKPLELGVPFVDEVPGKPANRLSQRGLGTLNRIDPVWLNLQRTRLLDPMLSFMGANHAPGDYRASGCSACHVIYANDRSPDHSGPYAKYGNRGRTVTVDPTIPKDQAGHPIRHVFTSSIPSSQCVTCHHHPGTTVTNSYLGYTWWDNETDGELMYPETERQLTAPDVWEIQQRNPEGAALRGKWSDPEFLANITDLNPKLTRTQFGDFHGHGWVFRRVYKQDRKGRLLDADNRVVAHDDPDRFTKAVHLKDIHLERGMHCTDCHFKQDAHGDGKLYAEVRAAVEIGCVDCHGTIQERATLTTSGPAAPGGGTDLSLLRTPFGQRRFQWLGDVLIQRSTVTKEVEWQVPQTADTVNPVSAWAIANPEKAAKSRYAKTIRRDGATWGDVVPKEREWEELAHADARMTCQSCHTAWVTSCFGCHLPMKANERKPALHNEPVIQRNWTSYNFQTLRDDAFMLAIDSTVMKNRISPARSSCAVLVGSQNQNREWVYSQQQTVSAEGYSGHAFSTFVPHTVRATETRSCSDCHLSAKNDNNAWMAQVLMQGTNFYNFIGRYAYVASGRAGFEAITVTEREEPQAVIGSYLHRLAFPTEHARHEARGRQLTEKFTHRGRDVLDVFGRDEIRSIQLRGEYLYTANGPGGFRAYDVAQIDQKGYSQRVVTSPVSPLGQRLHVKTRYATAVASPSTLAVDPTRRRRAENEEQPIHLVYAFLYVTDKYEGLVVIGNKPGSRHRTGIATLLDGDPTNNFIDRAATFNPEGALDGAVNLAVAGTTAYIAADNGLAVVSLEDPLNPKLLATVGGPHVVQPRAVRVQFRYAFVVDSEGLKVLDVTVPAHPRPVPNAVVPLADARNLYVVRGQAYVAAGKDGLAIIDVERPEAPRLQQVFNAGGVINDAHDVKLGMTNASLFAYVADGTNGLRVIQLTSPADTPTYLGFSPQVSPRLIATAATRGPALAVSEGTDRDRAVDESGNQIAVFNRIGSRPFNRGEMERLYLQRGVPYTVQDEPATRPRDPVTPKKEEEPARPPAPRLRRGGRALGASRVHDGLGDPVGGRRWPRGRPGN